MMGISEKALYDRAKVSEEESRNKKDNSIVEDIKRKNRKSFEGIGTELGQLVQEKNDAYGDSFAQAGKFLELLYPNGITPRNYQDMLAIIRIFDKLKRIATNKDAFGESPWKDVVGYGILGVFNDQ